MSVSVRTRPIVALDGPAGAGKSTTARLLAERLGFELIDTGALYRALAWVARDRGISWDDSDRLGTLARELTFEFRNNELWVDGQRVAAWIRTAEISAGASEVSRHPPVREALLGVQRRLGEQGGVVMEGRDIASVVFPDAEYKFYMTADARVRAARRQAELHAAGKDADFDTTLREIIARDEQDSSRAVAPLQKVQGAVTIDTTDRSTEEVVESLAAIILGLTNP